MKRRRTAAAAREVVGRGTGIRGEACKHRGNCRNNAAARNRNAEHGTAGTATCEPQR